MKKLLLICLALFLTGNLLAQDQPEKDIKALEKKVDSLTTLARETNIKAKQFDKVLEIHEKELNAEQKDFVAEVKAQNIYIAIISTLIGLAGVGGAFGFLYNNWRHIKKLSEEEAEKAVQRQREDIEKEVGKALRSLMEAQETFIQNMLAQAKLEEKLKAESELVVINFTPDQQAMKNALQKMGFDPQKMHVFEAQKLPQQLPRYDLLFLNNEKQAPDKKLYRTFSDCLERQTKGSKPTYFYFGQGRFSPEEDNNGGNGATNYPKDDPQTFLNFANSRATIHSRLVELLTADYYFSNT